MSWSTVAPVFRVIVESVTNFVDLILIFLSK